LQTGDEVEFDGRSGVITRLSKSTEAKPPPTA